MKTNKDQLYKYAKGITSGFLKVLTILQTENDTIENLLEAFEVPFSKFCFDDISNSILKVDFTSETFLEEYN